MLRTMIAATAALALAAPALAQDTDLLTGDPWECKAVSLVGNPVSDLMLGFGEGGEMLVSFFMSLPVQDNTVSVEFDLAGTWTLDGSLVTIAASDFSMSGAWMNDEPMAAEESAALEASLAEEFSDYTGQDTIAFISEHALVLQEDETSVSCWR
jgi:hypothetical protein